MKRMIGLLLALLLALSAANCAAAANNVFKTAYFTITLPDGWETDTTPLDEDEKVEDAEYLGIFGTSKGVGLAAIAYLVYYEDLKDISLWNSDEADLARYTKSVMEDFAEDRPEYLGTVMAGSIPFILIKGTDEDGEYLYADTMTNGYAIEIQAFVMDEDWEKQYPMTDKYIEQFKNVLSTFQPVT
ncbi:MAG: hypothetical protein IK099_04930 [Clostridia bacterium]|nr:hypothetical protein [Clostridia bacterium]